MFDFAHPGAVALQAVESFDAERGHWIVQFAIDNNVFWQVDFPEVTEKLQEFDVRFEMRQTAIKLFTAELRRRLYGEVQEG